MLVEVLNPIGSPSYIIFQLDSTMDAEIASDIAALREIPRTISVMTKDLRNLRIMLQEAKTKPADKAELEIRVIRRVRKEIIARRRGLEQELGQGMERSRSRFYRSFGRLPFDVRIHVMRHTRLEDLDNFRASGSIVRDISDTHLEAVFRGIEVAQFSELSWLFGDSIRRSPQQKQALKDFIGTYMPLKDPVLLKRFQSVDDDKFTGRLNIRTLNKILHEIDAMASKANLTRRMALCFAFFDARRTIFRTTPEATADHNSRQIGGPGEQILEWDIEDIPIDERIALFEAQPAVTRSKIRTIFEHMVLETIRCFDYLIQNLVHLERYTQLLGEDTADWIKRYYSPDKTDYQMAPRLMETWIANLLVGFILEAALQNFGWNCMDIATTMLNQPPDLDFSAALGIEFLQSGSTDGFWKEGRDFAKRMEFDLSCVLEGTEVKSYLQKLLASEQALIDSVSNA